MKKLKIILPLLLISLFFILNVRALSSDYYYEPKNTDALQDLIDNNQDKISKIKAYVETNGIGNYYPLNSSEDYVLAIQITNINSNFYVRLINYTSYINGYKTSNLISTFASNQYGTSGVLTWPQTIYQRQFHFVDGEIEPVNSATQTSSNFGWSSITTCDPRNDNCILDNGTWYFDTSYIKNDVKFFINNTWCNGISGTCLYVPLKSGDSIYPSDDYISIKSLLDNLQIKKFTCDLEYLGSFRDVQAVTFRIQGTTNALAEPLRGNVVLTSLGLDWNNFNGNISDIVVQTNEGPNFEEYLSETHNISYKDGQLYFYYEVTSEDDIDTYIDILYTIIWNNVSWDDFFEKNIEIRACQPRHGTFTYAYTDNLTGVTNSTDNILMNFLNNGSVPSIKPLQDLIRDYPTGPIDGIITMPLTILQALLNKLNNNTCSPLNLTIPFTGGTLILPCINTLYDQIDGLNTFLTWFSGIFSAFLIYKYFIFLYKWVDDTLTLRENNHFGGY